MYVVGVEACLRYFINCLQLSLTLNLTNSIKNIKTTYNLDTFFIDQFLTWCLYISYIFFYFKNTACSHLVLKLVLVALQPPFLKEQNRPKNSWNYIKFRQLILGDLFGRVKLLKVAGCVHLVRREWNCQEVLLVSISLSFSMKKARG